MENQVSDITAFLKGMQARLDSQHEALKQSLDANTSTLQDLSNWRPQVQAEVHDLQSSIKDLQIKVEKLTSKHEETRARKVFDVEHLNLTGSAAASSADKSHETPHRQLGHGDAHDHWGSGNGVVTTFIPTLVTGAGISNSLSLGPFVMGSPYSVDASQFSVEPCYSTC